jgi:hypothetical protein
MNTRLLFIYYSVKNHNHEKIHLFIAFSNVYIFYSGPEGDSPG